MNGISPTSGIPGALQSATGAINRASKGLHKDAAVTAASTAVESHEMPGALVDSRQQLLYTQAAAKIIRASDEMLQSLIDIRA